GVDGGQALAEPGLLSLDLADDVRAAVARDVLVLFHAAPSAALVTARLAPRRRSARTSTRRAPAWRRSPRRRAPSARRRPGSVAPRRRSPACASTRRPPAPGARSTRPAPRRAPPGTGDGTPRGGSVA